MRGKPIILDGIRLARVRAPILARRVEALEGLRGSPPRLALIAFNDTRGRSPFATRKLAAAERAGIDVGPLFLPPEINTRAAEEAITRHLADRPWDGVFIEFPYPPSVDGEEIEELIPLDLDLDIMTTTRIERYINGLDRYPPLTIAAVLELLDAYDLSIAGRRGVIVADDSTFARAFAEAITRRGAQVEGIIPPDVANLRRRVANADLAIISAGRPAILRTVDLAPGTIAIDVGYFNPGGRGDLDTGEGIEHLAAIAPVPGSVGPMTISALIERIINFAEDRSAPS